MLDSTTNPFAHLRAVELTWMETKMLSIIYTKKTTPKNKNKTPNPEYAVRKGILAYKGGFLSWELSLWDWYGSTISENHSVHLKQCHPEDKGSALVLYGSVPWNLTISSVAVMAL